MPVLEASSVSVQLGPTLALDGVSLSVEPGELVALTGPNGSGKTTLLRAMLGVVKHGGTVRRTGDMGYLPQHPSSLPGQTVGEVLLSGRPAQLRSFGIETDVDLAAVERVAGRLQLDSLLHRRIETLSGGQRQRVFIGRALVRQPAGLLLDEPTTFLDLRHQVELHRLLRTLSREDRLAVLLASHDLNLAAAHCDRIGLLSAGRLVAIGPPSQVLRAQLLADVYGVVMNRVEIDGQLYMVPVV